MTRQERRARIAHVISDANNPKHRLMALRDEMEKYSTKHAKTLERIIWRLESWQQRVTRKGGKF